MKKLISSLIIISFASNVAFANCDFSKGITENPDHTYTYTEVCHLQVGLNSKKLELSLLQIKDLREALIAESEALKIANQRVELWKATSNKLEVKVNQMEELKSRNEKLYFIGGFLLGILAYSLAKK